MDTLRESAIATKVQKEQPGQTATAGGEKHHDGKKDEKKGAAKTPTPSQAPGEDNHMEMRIIG